jgi:hypothetical protein
VHPTEVLLTVIRSIELLVADIALERLFLAVNRLVPRVQISAIRGVWTIWTGVALIATSGVFVFALHAVLQVQQKLGNFFQDGIFTPQRTVRVLFVVLAGQVHSDAPGPGRIIVASGTLEHAEIGVSSQPMFGDPGQEADTAAVKAAKQFVSCVVRRHFGRIPRQQILTLDPRRLGWCLLLLLLLLMVLLILFVGVFGSTF